MASLDVKLSVVVDEVFSENAYIVYLSHRNDCLIFDPGLDPQGVIDALQENSLVPAAILNTHGHADHIAGNSAVKDHWPACPLVIGERDAPKLSDAVGNLSATYGLSLTSPVADVLVNEPDVYRAAGFELEVSDTPGHSIGHVIYLWKGHSPWIVFGGDVLFQGSVGRTDFPDGSFEQLQASIQEKLFCLPDDTIVLPGHGPQTTIGQEKQFNPVVGLR